MFGSLRRRLAFVVAAALASCTGVAPAAAQATVVHAPADASKPGKRGPCTDLPRRPGLYGHKGARISMAQQQRAAAKKRRIARNRRHHR
jgi:hypothetical protein